MEIKELLKNKVVVVTGGAGLLGKEFVKGIMECGGTAIITDVDEKKGKEVENELLTLDLKGKCEFLKMNIIDKNSIRQVINYLNDKYGKIDALVNNAYPRNKNYGRKFEDVEYKDFCENVSLHLGGYFLTSQQFAYYFKKQGYGNIISIASIYGVVAPRFEIYEGTNMTMPVEYACIKSAIVHLTKYMAKYFKGQNIRFNCISPGGIIEGQPQKFLESYKRKCLNKGMLNKCDLKGTLVYILSDMSKYVNGQNIIIDDGFVL
jgi:NAD(P)-dependent dehydrogenase (short-subunit alcohol dehydrogenase family)